MTYPLLNGLRVIESSAFIAAPLAGLTLAQFGADVIRVDMIGGGIDYGRLPRMPSGRSIYWTGLNKAKRSAGSGILVGPWQAMQPTPPSRRKARGKSSYSLGSAGSPSSAATCVKPPSAVPGSPVAWQALAQVGSVRA